MEYRVAINKKKDFTPEQRQQIKKFLSQNDLGVEIKSNFRRSNLNLNLSTSKSKAKVKECIEGILKKSKISSWNLELEGVKNDTDSKKSKKESPKNQKSSSSSSTAKGKATTSKSKKSVSPEKEKATKAKTTTTQTKSKAEKKDKAPSQQSSSSSKAKSKDVQSSKAKSTKKTKATSSTKSSTKRTNAIPLEDAVGIFLKQQKGSFTVDMVEAYVEPLVKEEDLELLEEFLFTPGSPVFYNEDEFHSREEYLQGAYGLISLGKRERKEKGLFLGPNFMAYLSSSLGPEQCQVMWKGKTLNTKILKISLLEVHELLEIPLHKKMKELKSELRKMKIEFPFVCLKDFLKQTKFAEEDQISFLVKDWAKGIVEIQHVPDKDYAKKKRIIARKENIFAGGLETALNEVVGLAARNRYKVAYGLFLAGSQVLQSPGINPNRVIRENSKFVYKTGLSNFPVLVHKDSDPVDIVEAEALLAEEMNILPELSPIDNVFQDHGSPYNELELEVYMRQALSEDRGIYSVIEEYLEDFDLFEFEDEKEEKQFVLMLEEKWDETDKRHKKDENSDVKFLREKAIEIIEKHEIGEEIPLYLFSDVSLEDMQELAGTLRDFHRVLVSLNGVGKEISKDKKNLEKELQRIDEELDKLPSLEDDSPINMLAAMIGGNPDDWVDQFDDDWEDD